MKTAAVVLLGCGLFLFACTDTGTNGNQLTRGFAIYKLADTTIQASSVWGASLDSLELNSMPFLTQTELQAYYWSTHMFVANASIDSEFSHMKYLLGKSGGLPFVVVVDQSRIYIGAFWWNYSSSVPQGSFIVVGAPSPYLIHHRNGVPIPDRRSDPRIYEALSAAGILQE
jgi:hypothetical protein